MAQHFLLSAKSRTLSLKAIYQGGEDKAYETFCQLRWYMTNGEPVCPRCGCLEPYSITTRRKFKCRGCQHQFSVTSGTIFASRKLSFTDLMAAICIFVNGAKGISSVQLSRDLDVQYKTAWVLAHKIREAIADEVDDATLHGEVEVDGAYFGGHVRPRNWRENRVDRRLKEHQPGTRRVVVAIRQRRGRTLTFVRNTEAQGVADVRRVVDLGSTVFSDEASHWMQLAAHYPTKMVNHEVAYSMHGVHTNYAESYFSRLRRMVAGQHHFVSPKYLHQYASHAAWLEDHRRESNGTLARRVIRNAMAAPVSRVFKGYWQRAA